MGATTLDIFLISLKSGTRKKHLPNQNNNNLRLSYLKSKIEHLRYQLSKTIFEMICIQPDLRSYDDDGVYSQFDLRPYMIGYQLMMIMYPTSLI